MLEIKGVTKNYAKKAALKDINLIFEDKIYGLLGRNGAGKTTLINIIANRIFPTSGEILFNGAIAKENSKVQERMFCMTEKSNYPGEMKVKDGFYWTKQLHKGFDTDYAYSLSKKFGLQTEKRIRALSTGYQSIFRLILALSSDADIIILDEPVLGLDANFRKTFYEELIQNYIEKPRAIIISTHLIEEIAGILEDVIIIEDGEILLSKPAEEVLKLAYTVSGSVSNVDSYLEKINENNSNANDKRLIGSETIGAFKVATIYGTRSKADDAVIKKYNLEITGSKLQDLFVAVTNRAKEITAKNLSI